MTLHQGYDYAAIGDVARFIRDARPQFVMRYISGGSWKRLGSVEKGYYAANHVPIGLIYEEGAGDFLGGYSTGRRHAVTANAWLRSYRVPKNVAVWYAIDRDPNDDGTWAKVRDYLAGVKAAADHPVGVYGGYRVMSLLGEYRILGWQTYAWSDGKWHDDADIQQYANGVTVAGQVVDKNRASSLAWFWGTPVPSDGRDKTLLRRGSRGPAVKRVQEMLNGFGEFGTLAVDGIFGPRTEGAVRAFQTSRYLQVDGIVGPFTWSALKRESK